VIGWVDASSGASGDMLLGALIDAGVPLAVLTDAIDSIAPEAIVLTPEAVTRQGFAALHCRVETAESTTHRTWGQIQTMLEEALLAPEVRTRALRTFERLAAAEGRVHGVPAEEVHFHEVGALDALADVVGVCAGLAHLGLARLVVSPIAVGSGRVDGAHGSLPIPPPAVADLLVGFPSYAGPIAREMCTPTGAALLTANADDWAVQPAMVVDAIGVGAGGRDNEGVANVLRLFVGEEVSTSSTTGASSTTGGPLLLETNVDDLDPRLWPDVIARLLEAGAADAWLTPIVMKKGRPAHTLSALVSRKRAEDVRAVIFRHTSTIGLREIAITKTELDREMRTVQVGGHVVRVKLALHHGRVVNAQPEYDDIAAVASATDRPLKDVLAEALAATREM